MGLTSGSCAGEYRSEKDCEWVRGCSALLKDFFGFHIFDFSDI